MIYLGISIVLEKIVMKIQYSKDLNKLLSLSIEEAQRLHSVQVEPAHLLLGLLSFEESRGLQIIKSMGVDEETLRTKSEKWIQSNVQQNFQSTYKTIFSNRIEKLLKLAVLEGMNAQAKEINTGHLLLAILRENNNEVCGMLTSQGVSYIGTSSMLNEKSAHLELNVSNHPKNVYGFADDDVSDMQKYAIVEDSVTKKSSTPMLDNFGRDLTISASKGLLDPVVGRENEILRVSQILSRRKKNNPILIGESGVGKSAIVEGLALRIVRKEVSRILWDKRIIALDMASVVAGTKYRGQFEERIRNIIKEVQANPDIILFIDEIHTIVGAGGATGTMDAANMLKPALARGEFQCIGATTIDEYRKSIEKDGALERRFQRVIVEPTSPDETLEILKNLKERYEEHHNVKFTKEALAACVALTNQYVTDRSFPDKAIDVLDETGARVHITNLPINTRLLKLETEKKNLEEKKRVAILEQDFNLAAVYRDKAKDLDVEIEKERQEWETVADKDRMLVTESDVADVVALITGIPVQRIGQNENERLKNLKSVLQQKVIGQKNAIDRVVRAIQRSRVGLKDPNKPIGTFMFLGPTGVGKTYLTQKLAEELLGSKDALIRVDMSEYMEKHAVSRLVGAPPGYVGYEEGGQLTERVRRHPYSIILLDEIEKAHTDVFNILLQVMDEGRMTDGNGVTIDFKNTIIIMTSNCGTRQLKDFGVGIGFDATRKDLDVKASRDVLSKSLNRQFSPEFLNRIDDIVYFDQLSREDVLRMTDLCIAPLVKRLEGMGVRLEITDEAKKFIAEKGYDIQFGARPLSRTIQTYLEDVICEVILNDKIENGTRLVALLDIDKTKIEINKL